jgi:hypothetical protein
LWDYGDVVVAVLLASLSLSSTYPVYYGLLTLHAFFIWDFYNTTPPLEGLPFLSIIILYLP